MKERARNFFYLPFIHSESLAVQDAAVRLVRARLHHDHPARLHARAHREIVRRVGRFPGRNAALGRATTPEEAAWLESGGYARELKRLSR